MEVKTQEFGDLFMLYGLNIVAALAIFIIGKWLAKKVARSIRTVLERQKVDITLSKFAGNLTYAGLLTFVTLAALARLGIQTASFIAVIGAASLAIGLALQGSLSNFAAGVLVLLFRPYRVGDFVNTGGVMGTVEEIQIFNTVLTAPDGVKIILPNSQATSGVITNFAANPTRRIEIKIGISYSDDIAKTKKVLMDAALADARILKDPAPAVVLVEYGASAVVFAVRVWTKALDFGDALGSLMETLKTAVERNGLTMPFPSQDLWIKEVPSEETEVKVLH